MKYQDLKSNHPDVFNLPESMSEMSQNIRILKTKHDAEWDNLMPILLSFWRETLASDASNVVAGLIPLSGSCLPIKSFRKVVDRDERLRQHSIFNFANGYRTKASLWGYMTRSAVYEMAKRSEGKELSDEKLCRSGGASEEHIVQLN